MENDKKVTCQYCNVYIHPVNLTTSLEGNPCHYLCLNHYNEENQTKQNNDIDKNKQMKVLLIRFAINLALIVYVLYMLITRVIK